MPTACRRPTLSAAIKGMLLPAAGPKGFGLAMMIDLLAGGLSSGAVGGDVRPLYGDPKVPYACAHYFLAIDVAAFRPVVDFAAVVEALTARVRTSKPAPGVERVLAPGDPALAARRQAAGFVTLDSATVAALDRRRRKHAIHLPTSYDCSERFTMPKKQLTSKRLRQPNGHFSQATMIEAKGRLVFISGMTSRRADGTIAGIGNIEEQTKQVCENLKAAVEEAGGTLDDVCRVDVYVRNMEHFDQIHKVRREYFKAPAPASTMVEVCKMTSPEYLIEINAIAVSNGRRRSNRQAPAVLAKDRSCFRSPPSPICVTWRTSSA